MKPVRYTVLREDRLAELVKDVNLRIKAGWVPLGNVSVTSGSIYPDTYFQTMVHYEEQDYPVHLKD